MSRGDIKLQLHVSEPTIEGDGSELVYKVRGHRLLKSGRYQHYELELRACRYSVRKLLAELRKMHLRDRERIQGELERIEREQKELTQETACS